MLSVSQSHRHALHWSQPSALQREFELRADGELVGTLRFHSTFGTLASVESADGRWTFKRVGFLQGRATIRVAGSPADLAVFSDATWESGGTLAFASGPTFKATSNLWETRLEWRGAADEPLVRFDTSGILRHSAAVHVEPAAERLAELPLLVFFGWYLAIMLAGDSASTTATLAAIV